MIIGLPKEIKDNEYRVAMSPGGIRQLVETGHRVLVQAGAGEDSGFTDVEYQKVGAEIVRGAAEAWNTQMVIKVKEPQPIEYNLMRPELLLFTFLHLAADKELTTEMMNRGVTGIAYETVELSNGRLPLLTPMSEVAGRIAVQAGAHYLEKINGGRGKLLSGAPGVRPAKVSIIGRRGGRQRCPNSFGYGGTDGNFGHQHQPAPPPGRDAARKADNHQH